MKKKIVIIFGVIVLLGISLYFSRHWLLDVYEGLNKPSLPTPVAYDDQKQEVGQAGRIADPPPSPIEGGMATSEHFVLESSPQNTQPKTEPVDPLAVEVQIPTELNLDVPWMSQAPNSNWDYPYQEACEEASMIMVDRFYKKQTGRIDPDDADKAILDLVDYEKESLGMYEDTNAEETAKIISDYFGYKDVRVLPLTSALDIKSVLARGYPVIVPFSGKDLKNPNYKNGGPLYHMMVIKGYTNDEQFITGDPGTRKGQDYIYPYDRIMEAAHDWNGGNVSQGAKYMIIVLPNLE
ncbi:C39 family peptidase [Patescibacteria group bacterium]|nr:C39 family peptidase [Patescibacteria group bacterium]